MAEQTNCFNFGEKMWTIDKKASVIAAAVTGSVTAAVLLYKLFKKRDSTVIPLEKILEEYDYIVVGAGSSGSVLAARLSEDADKTVLLLEAGGEETSDPSFKVPLAYGKLQLSNTDWKYFTEPQSKSSLASMVGGNHHYWPRGKVLGGCSQNNYMQYVRGSRHDYDEWAENGCDGWSYDDVLPYFLKSEDCLIDELKASPYHNTGGPLGVSKESALSELNEKFVEAGKEIGFKEVDSNGEEQIGFSASQVTVRGGERGSTAREFLLPAMGRSNLHVAVNAQVMKVEITDFVASGITFIKDGKMRTVKAKKEIVLSAGTIGSPQILMLSGIGPRSHLESFGLPVYSDLPVGENLQDHLHVMMQSDINKSIGITEGKASSFATLAKYVVFRSGVLASTGVCGTAFVKSRLCKSKYPDVQIHMSAVKLTRQNVKIDHTLLHGLFPEESRDGMSFVPILLHPKSRGTIRLRSSNPFDYPAIDPKYLDNDEDVKVFIEAIRFVEKLYGTNALKTLGASMQDLLGLDICKGLPTGSDEYWERFIRHTALTVFHPTSTCKMGPAGDPTTVVDPALRVKGIQGLRVADASIMPNVVSGNTNAPCIMIAEKAADLIRAKDTVIAIRGRIRKTASGVKYRF